MSPSSEPNLRALRRIPIRPLLCIVALVVLAFCAKAAAQVTLPPKKGEVPKVIGMYVHQHWPYKHPYAARTWTLEDWRGYLDGLHRLGFNTVMIWPMLETMPQPLTASDRENLEKIARVIDVAHADFGMKVWIVISPNTVADDSTAGLANFTDRHFYHCDIEINPADTASVSRMMERREELFRPLAKTDGVAIIDSDPGGYPGSTNEEFVNLLALHRQMLDRLRPGIELDYWIWLGWEATGRLYQAGKYTGPTEEERFELLRLLRHRNLEPWGLMNPYQPQRDALPYARKLGIDSRVIELVYHAIESEPSFPMTNFGGDRAYQAGTQIGPRGVMGNAQTHCVQLPNTFAFARGALGQPVSESDYLAFAEKLIPGEGATILAGWKAVAGSDAVEMRSAADRLQSAAGKHPEAGPLRGLLFGAPERFLVDLAFQLRMKSATVELRAAADEGRNLEAPLEAFITAAEAWQQRNGYQCTWSLPELRPVFEKLDSPEINAALACVPQANTPFGKRKEINYFYETQTTRLLTAMKAALHRRKAQAK